MLTGSYLPRVVNRAAFWIKVLATSIHNELRNPLNRPNFTRTESCGRRRGGVLLPFEKPSRSETGGINELKIEPAGDFCLKVPTVNLVWCCKHYIFQLDGVRLGPALTLPFVSAVD